MFCAVVPQTPTVSSSAGSGSVEDGSSFTLTCTTASTGITSPQYIWTIDGTDQAAQSSSTLAQTADINNVVGAYTCKVSADGGTDYSAVTTTSFTHSGRWQHIADGSGRLWYLQFQSILLDVDASYCKRMWLYFPRDMYVCIGSRLPANVCRCLFIDSEDSNVVHVYTLGNCLFDRLRRSFQSTCMFVYWCIVMDVDSATC